MVFKRDDGLAKYAHNLTIKGTKKVDQDVLAEYYSRSVLKGRKSKERIWGRLQPDIGPFPHSCRCK